MSPAEELREAARLMRERAQAASPGPWERYEHDLGDGTSYWDVAAPSHDRPGYAQYVTPPRNDPKGAADSAYIAGMHPLVALAVADWLDSCGAKAEGVIDEPVSVEHALDVARAYLAPVLRGAQGGGK